MEEEHTFSVSLSLSDKVVQFLPLPLLPTRFGSKEYESRLIIRAGTFLVVEGRNSGSTQGVFEATVRRFICNNVAKTSLCIKKKKKRDSSLTCEHSPAAKCTNTKKQHVLVPK